MNPKDTEIIDRNDLAEVLVAAGLFVAGLVLLGVFVWSI